MIFIKKNRSRQRRGTPVVSVQKDIEQLHSHDWSDPLLDDYFATVVEKLTRKPEPTGRRDEEGEVCPPPAKRAGQNAS